MRIIRPNTLCYIINSRAGNNGRVVTAIKNLGRIEIRMADGSRKIFPCWSIHPGVPDFLGEQTFVIAEYQLLPIIPGQKETNIKKEQVLETP